MSTTQTEASTPRTTRRTFVLIAIIIGMFMAAIEATIVATAMPSIVADLGGFSKFSWVFSIFLLMQAVTIPIYGKLADLFGRKRVYMIGIVIFLIGSILCGLAPSMPLLIAFRLIQGIGAGAVQPIASTIVGDIYSIEERSKIQGYLASVWGVSSIIGPAIGGFFVEYLNWAWIFWINVPFGILSLAGIIFFLHENIEHKKHSIDYLGSGLLFVSVSALMVALIQAGVAWSWTSVTNISLLALFLIGMISFLLQEKRAVEPMMPLGIWKNRIISIANLGSLTTGMIMIGVISYIPTYVQGVMERSAIVGGFTLAMMSIGWPISATIAGKSLLRLGFLKNALIGGVSLIIGSLLLIVSQPEYGPISVGIGAFFVGVGMGFCTTTFIVSVQSNVTWKERGVATASNMFMRILGSTIGISLMGGLLNSQLSQYIKTHSMNPADALDIEVTNTLLDPVKRKDLSPETITVLQEGLTLSLHHIFWGLLILSAISLFLILFLPNKVKTLDEKRGHNPIHVES